MDRNISRREALKVGAVSILSGLAACAPDMSSPLPATPEDDNSIDITFLNELDNFAITFNFSQFMDISRRYGVPESNFQDLNIVFGEETTDIGNSTIIDSEPVWVTTESDKTGPGQINIAFGTVLDEYLKYYGIQANQDVQKGFLSTFASYGVFVGHLKLGVQKDLFDQSWAKQTWENYLINVLELKDRLFIGVLPQPSNPSA